MVIIYPKKGKKPSRPKVRNCQGCQASMGVLFEDEEKIVYRCGICKGEASITKEERALNSGSKKKPKDSYLDKYIKLRDRSKEKKNIDEEQHKTEKTGALDESTNKKEEEQTEEKKPEGIPDKVRNIKDGMDNKKIIAFQYVSKSGKKSTRAVEPYKIEKDARGNIILWAYCTEGEGIRRFVFSSMSKISNTKYDFKPKWPIEYKLKK